MMSNKQMNDDNLLKSEPSKKVPRLDQYGSVYCGYTVKEIRQALESLPDDLLVLGEWEGMHVPIQAIKLLKQDSNIYKESVVIFDADTH